MAAAVGGDRTSGADEYRLRRSRRRSTGVRVGVSQREPASCPRNDMSPRAGRAAEGATRECRCRPPWPSPCRFTWNMPPPTGPAGPRPGTSPRADLGSPLRPAPGAAGCDGGAASGCRAGGGRRSRPGVMPCGEGPSSLQGSCIVAVARETCPVCTSLMEPAMSADGSRDHHGAPPSHRPPPRRPRHARRSVDDGRI